ncbi:helix-turn-helix domain-containing protein [Solirubrobacter ginsenosidimutans]|uniref:Helix-turn-helix domain-containing protein n=1 Tax=Solirubrobacter ginsenosidimutans TaxID=490573 RepID=A0A9X3MZ04_9ACTN|nr:helix-turn-helix domain-containing protein [Solirubrobacter ginsenosidimutans]MDA0164231.1 helix-turn-helix domain-containing protein [Solirubrobacter ginsenosidimutans]
MEGSDEQTASFGEVMRRLRQDAGLSQAGLAAAAGIHARQINRYESGEQQPALDVAQRLAGALSVTLDELAGGSSDRVKLSGTWWAAWQTFNQGEQVIATQPVGLNQYGSTIQIEALERSTQNERGGYLWRGELRLWDGQVLMGYYAAADGNVRSKGTMYLVLHAQGDYAHGRWVGLSYDGPVVSGYATLAHTQDAAEAVMAKLLDAAPMSS